MWRNAVDGNRDMYVASSPDGGKSWGAASKLGEGAWKLDACPMDGGGIAHDAHGDIVTVWRREAALFLDEPGKPEHRLGEGKNAALAIGSRGTYVVWQSAKGVEAKQAGHDAVEVLDSDGTFPQLVTLGDGRVLAAWERKGTLQFQVF